MKKQSISQSIGEALVRVRLARIQSGEITVDYLLEQRRERQERYEKIQNRQALERTFNE